ncbi:adaptin ear-binding coat-associated protein 1 [Plasmopara halstedii]|uniref:Adaptin ear-binding coat-associated protein 1 n=1 Tax=Plasmopara halstedii TaxID=4781 RepID=A0A0P1AV86_PLAHL|nr:adaptin ear-binding coat-associated protein 1 [Plasmopara halstedii]CEG46241.1 adaptin ear-binding coat-associated protein 1 [Plasmopara halstedii]|eukprot:XP_024582610.1 adaptin ear-binding coat-associated protein 1 [Plasmopara halstedii]
MMTDSADVFELERTLFNEKNVWVYQVPAGQVTSLAPRADAWDPAHPLFTGSVRVLQKGDACYVQLFEPVAEGSVNPTLFAQCPLRITRELSLDVYVHDCVDSSRYFMLRVEDEQSERCAFVGIGFSARSMAFNFKATLQDYAKYVLRQLGVQPGAATTAAETISLVKQDLSLPPGTTLRINLKTNASEDGDKCRKDRKCGKEGAVSPAQVPLIPPPPCHSTEQVENMACPQKLSMSTIADDEEDWGEFVSA